MPGGVEVVRIEGLKQLQAALRELDRKLPAELRKVNLSVAQMVAAKAVATAQGVSRMAAKASSGIKARAEQRNASVVLSASAGVPFALGAEFGAGHDSPRARSSGSYLGYNQFQPWRGGGSSSGYFLYPSVRSSGEAIVDAYDQRLGVLLAQAFPD